MPIVDDIKAALATANVTGRLEALEQRMREAESEITTMLTEIREIHAQIHNEIAPAVQSARESAESAAERAQVAYGKVVNVEAHVDAAALEVTKTVNYLRGDYFEWLESEIVGKVRGIADETRAAYRTATSQFNTWKGTLMSYFKQARETAYYVNHELWNFVGRLKTLRDQLAVRAQHIVASFSSVFGVPTLTHPFKLMNELKYAMNNLSAFANLGSIDFHDVVTWFGRAYYNARDLYAAMSRLSGTSVPDAISPFKPSAPPALET